MKKRIGVLCMLILGTIATTRADPPSGVTPTLIGRATYSPLAYRQTPVSSSSRRRPSARSTSWCEPTTTRREAPLDGIRIRVRSSYRLEGKVTFYESNDPTCTPKVVCKGEGYVDTGHGHIGRNESGAPAKDVTVFIAPVSLAFRGELPAAVPQCKFSSIRPGPRAQAARAVFA